MSKFSETNYRLLRVSKTRALQLMLLLSKQDVEWFTDATFQHVLTMLRPLIQARVEYFSQGIPAKQLQPQRPARAGSAMVARAVAAAKASANNSSTSSATSTPSATASGQGSTGSPANDGNTDVVDDDLLDGLDDLGMVLGGDDQQSLQEEGDTLDSAQASNRRRRQRRLGAGAKATPRFRVRFGFRDHMASERGAMSVMVRKKNLEFKIKREMEDPAIGKEVGGMRILQEEEDEDALARRLLHPQLEDDGDAEAMQRDKRARLSDTDEEKDQKLVGEDSKPTLEVSYQPLRMFPMTLYIVIRTEPGSSMLATASPPPPSEEQDDLLPAALVHG